MKLSQAQITALLNASSIHTRIILLYGPDAGLISERATQIAKKIAISLDDPFSVTRLTSDQATNSAHLYDEMASQSLGGGRRLVRLSITSEAIASSLTKLLADIPAADSVLLIEAGDLDSKSKIRSLAESDNQAIVAIPCYVEDSSTRQRVIAEIFKQGLIQAPRDVCLFLADILPPDRAALRSEVEKLVLYAKSEGVLTIDGVRAVIKDASAAEMDDLMVEIGLGNARRVVQLLDHLFAEQTSPVALVRTAQRHFMRLHLARVHFDNGLSATEAVNKLQPKVFWKQVEPMAKQITRWPLAVLEKLLDRLEDVEALLKQSGTPDIALISQTLLAAAARK